MARNPISDMVAVGGMITAGIFGMKKRKQEKKEMEAAAAPEPAPCEVQPAENAAYGEVCGACGTLNMNGSATCPVCFAPMGPE